MSNSSLNEHFFETPSNQRSRLLIVDDDTTQLKFYQASLSKKFDCEFARTAKEAIALSKRFPLPELIVLDIEMPNLDGFELCKILKDDDITKDIPVIFATGASDLQSKTKGFRVGCVDYITKPVLIPEMQARINTHLKLRRQNKQLEALSYADPLTGIANRKRFNEALVREWHRCCRYGQAISLVLIDLDDFKYFNNFYGYSAGDECLIKLAKNLRKLVKRPGDVFARIGGEEFALVLTDCDRMGASIKADEVMQTLGLLNIENQSSPKWDKLTVSIGISISSPKPGDDPFELFRAADEALFDAKHTGKNQWIISKRFSGNPVSQIRSTSDTGQET